MNRDVVALILGGVFFEPSDVNKVQRRPIKVPKSELCQKLGHYLKILIYTEVQEKLKKWCSGDVARI